MIENLGIELKKQKACMERQDGVIEELKKQIAAYRHEIHDMHLKKANGKHRQEKLATNKVPLLDLSKVKQDSDDSGNEKGDDEQNFIFGES